MMQGYLLTFLFKKKQVHTRFILLSLRQENDIRISEENLFIR